MPEAEGRILFLVCYASLGSGKKKEEEEEEEEEEEKKKKKIEGDQEEIGNGGVVK